ncbi:MAG: alpha-L-fucosidase [Candidatus Bathyarchaeia archaeon]|nr:alpha-L-fucosidase [Candidatus Bathyarchaeota archaeon]
MSSKAKFTFPERLRWWIEARFGMFIHWGLYAIPARGEWVMYCERIPKSEYAKLARRFNPKRFNADEWVALAKEAGMRYMVLTTRHHDGFCLWDSQVSDFTSVKATPAKRDFIAEYVEACRRANMRIGFYYSLLDWRWPEYWDGPAKNPEGWAKFRDYVHAQVRELMTNYGKIDILWYDGAWPYKAEDWQSDRLNAMVRSLQPDIIINNRSGLPEDFETPEQHIRYYDRPWESCMTIDESWWGYHAGDKHLKSPLEIVRLLVRCVAGNGNLLLNVGPMADGSIPEAYKRRLRAVGEWLKRNGESIYGAGSAPFSAAHLGQVTAKGNRVYIHVFYWTGKGEICVAGIKNKAVGAYMLATGESLPFDQREDRLFVKGLPRRAPDPIDTVIAIDLEGEPEAAPPSFWTK